MQKSTNKPGANTALHYDKLSRYYDFFAGFFERKYIKKGLKLLNAKPSEKILEAGFGTGYALTHIARAVGPQGKPYGIDISKGMYNITKRRLKKKNLLDKVILENEDFLNSQLTENYFDAVFSSFTVEILDDKSILKFLKKTFLALKKNGRICLVCVTNPRKRTFMMRLYEFIHRMFPGFIDCRPVDIENFLTKAGFRIKVNERFSICGISASAILAVK